MKSKMISGNIKLSGSTVIPCKRPVSQLFRNFDKSYLRDGVQAELRNFTFHDTFYFNKL